MGYFISAEGGVLPVEVTFVYIRSADPSGLNGVLRVFDEAFREVYWRYPLRRAASSCKLRMAELSLQKMRWTLKFTSPRSISQGLILA